MGFNRHFFVGALFIIFVSCSKKGEPVTVTPGSVDSNTFTNPLLSSGPDPWVIRKDNFFYYTETLWNKIAIWKTTAMSRLTFSAPQTIWTRPSSGPNSQNVWAPELHYLDGKWYMYYAAGSADEATSQRIFVLENSSSDPTKGIWIDRGQIQVPSADFWAIDPTVFELNGKRYILWSGHPSNTDFTQHLYIALMQNPWTLSTSRTDISSPTYAWETIGANGSLTGVDEGPEILQNANGRVFLIFSASGCWTDDYELGMLTLKEGGDPLNASDWVKSATPVLTKNSDNNAFGPGHCSFFKSVDSTEDWIIYHANSFANQGCGDVRNPRMQKFTWNADGTPNFGQPVKINTPIPKPAGE